MIQVKRNHELFQSDSCRCRATLVPLQSCAYHDVQLHPALGLCLLELHPTPGLCYYRAASRSRVVLQQSYIPLQGCPIVIEGYNLFSVVFVFRNTNHISALFSAVLARYVRRPNCLFSFIDLKWFADLTVSVPLLI